MNFKTPYKIEDIKFENIRYVQKKVTDNKTIIYTKYEDKGKLNNFVIQTPSLKNVNNIINKNNVHELEIPLEGQNEYKTNLFIGFLNNLDRKIINDGKINTDWFDNFIENNMIKYQKTIRDSEQFKTGMIKIRILNNDNFETIVQENNKKNIKIKDIKPNCWVKMILEVYAIWVNKNGFGLFLRPILVSFKPYEKINYNYKFIDSDEEDDNIINTAINEESIFIKQINNNNNNNNTSVLEYPDYNNDLSPTSSE